MGFSQQFALSLFLTVLMLFMEQSIAMEEATQIIYEWKHDIIGNIKYSKFTQDNEIVVQSYRNQVMKFDVQGNILWSTSVLSAQLIKIQAEWIVLFDSSTSNLLYLSLNNGVILKQIPFDAFKNELPHMKSSNKVFLMYDANTVFWVISSKNPQANEDTFVALSYELSSNYRILNASISKDSEISLLVQYKKRKMCIARTVVIGQESKVQLLRCRQTVSNQSVITHSSLSGFIIRNEIAGDNQSAIRLVFVGSANIPEEELYITREPVVDIQSFDQSEVVIFQYATYFEVCNFAPQELICSGIYIRKQPYHFVPTFNALQILLLPSNETQKEEHNKQLSISLLDLRTNQIIEYQTIHFPEPITFVYANPKIFDEDMRPSISLLVQTAKRQAIFAELYIKQMRTYKVQEGSLEGDMSPAFYRYDNILADPYPLEQPMMISTLLEDSLLVASKVFSRIQHRWEADLNSLVNSFLSIDFQALMNWKGYGLINHEQEEDRLYGIEKIILIPSKHFRLFAFNSSNGKQIYTKTIQGQTDTNEVVGITTMALDSNGKKGYFLIINNQDNVVIQHISPEKGDSIEQTTIHFEEGERFQSFSKARLMKNSKKEHLLIFSSKQKVKFYPSLGLDQSTQLDSYLNSNTVIWLRQEMNSIQSYSLKSTYSSLESISVFSLKPNQRIIKVSQNTSGFDPFKVHQSIIPIESDGKDSYRSLDLEGKVYALLSLNQADKRLTLFLILASSSQVLFEKHMANVRVTQPIDMIMHQNMLYVSFFSDYYSKQILFELKFYFRIFITIFDLPYPQLPLENLVCDTKTIFSDQTISRLHTIVRDTHLIFTNFNSDIISLDLTFLNQTQSSSTLFNSTFRQINTFALSEIQSVYVDPTTLSSRFILFANGAQLYSFSYVPDGSFDTLPLDFNYQGVIISVIGCFMLLFISLCINAIKRRRQEKRTIF